MKRHLNFGSILLTTLILLSSTSPSWAHFHGRFGIFLGPGLWYPGPYYDPYDEYPYAYPYYDSYSYDSYGAAPERAAAPDDSRHDLTYLEGQLAMAREEINFDYDDGDITKEQRKMALRHLKEIRDEANSESKANGGFLTGNQFKVLLNELHGGPRQERSTRQASVSKTPNRNLGATTDKISQLRGLLDKKLSESNITKAQHDGMADYLARTEKQVRSQASANGGSLTRDQEEAVREQLERVERSIQRNLIMN